MTDKILFVDDDQNVLMTYRRNLRKRFRIETALGGEKGLESIDAQGPFAVVVSDLRMPQMDGVKFLAAVKERDADSVLMMLTGYGDAQMAFDAVNAGTVFRFLIKPCPQQTLIKALDAGIAQHKLSIAERELLERTLTGCVEVLTDILSLINPPAFSRAARIKQYVISIAQQLQLPNQWQLEVAAMLCQIGCVTVSPAILEKDYAGKPLTNDEQELYAAHPSVGSTLIGHIPRFEPVARMIAGQQNPFGSYALLPDSAEEREIMLGAQVLKVALGFDQAVAGGLSPKAALEELRGRPQEYNPELVVALSQGTGVVASFLAE
jgi:response regulator RpfG family c-di-GMP phosphodiesterase